MWTMAKTSNGWEAVRVSARKRDDPGFGWVGTVEATTRMNLASSLTNYLGTSLTR